MEAKYLGFGLGINPFWWQFGNVSHQIDRGRMFALGPIRISVRWEF